MQHAIDRQRTPRPIPVSWALSIILKLDTARPGFLNFLHSASALRRQGVFLALSQWDSLPVEHLAAAISEGFGSPTDNDGPCAAVASALMSRRVREIVHAVFGSTPQGIVGALSRCGDDPLEEFNYAILLAMCDDPSNRARANLLRNAREIDDDLIQVIWDLPPALLRPE